MKRFLVKYRFLFLNYFLQLIYIYCFALRDFRLIIFGFPDRPIEIVFTLSLLLTNGYYLIDTIFHYTKMYNEIIIRKDRVSYYFIIFKKSILCIVLFILSQFFFNYLASDMLYIFLTTIYYIVFILIFLLIIRLLNNHKLDILIFFFSLIIIMIKIFFTLLLKQ